MITLVAVVSATYAWYIYNTSRHTTNVHMAAGAGASLQISNSYDGTYGSAAVLDSFAGRLTPVSTNRVSGGFQKVEKFTEGSDNQPDLVASIFGSGERTDYYHTSLYLRTTGSATDIYLADIGFEDSSASSPISSAIRVGLVIHRPGRQIQDRPGHRYRWSSTSGSRAVMRTAPQTSQTKHLEIWRCHSQEL